MSVDTKSNANDLYALSKQLAALREDMSRMTHTVTGIAGRRGSNMASDIAERYDEAKHYVKKLVNLPNISLRRRLPLIRCWPSGWRRELGF